MYVMAQQVDASGKSTMPRMHEQRQRVVSNGTAVERPNRYSRYMTEDAKTMHGAGTTSTGYGHQVRGSRKGLGGDPPNDPSRRGLGLTSAVGIQTPFDDVTPRCPLCHTATTAVTAHTLHEGAYWRCERCGQMWDAIRLQTAANYTRHAHPLLQA